MTKTVTCKDCGETGEIEDHESEYECEECGFVTRVFSDTNRGGD